LLFQAVAGRCIVVVPQTGERMSEERFDRIDQTFTRIDQRFERVDQRLDALRADMNTGFAELRRHMGVLHEEVLDRIAGTREYTGPTREEFTELKEMIGRRIDPLEATGRQHSVEIERLKRKRP
jgi:hypothetical protein